MPGREYQAQPSRFGFNGKENDNDVKGFGNQQDYGMRVYDTRIGKFLSVDPLTKKFAWFSPYQFAGNNPNKFTDLDGAEPLDYSWHWIRSTEHPTKWHYSVFNVNDKWTEKVWTCMQYPNDNKIYYWKPYDGSHQTFDAIKSKNKDGSWNGRWVEFERQETLQARYGKKLADGIGIGVFGAFATIAAGIALEGALTTYGGKAIGNFILQTIREEIVETAVEKVTGIPILDLKDIAKGAGVIYRRLNLKTGKYYIGQSKSAERFEEKTGALANPNEQYEYEIIGSETPGKNLDALEETMIRKHGTPVTPNNPNGTLDNKRYQVNDKDYKSSGGTEKKKGG